MVPVEEPSVTKMESFAKKNVLLVVNVNLPAGLKPTLIIFLMAYVPCSVPSLT